MPIYDKPTTTAMSFKNVPIRTNSYRGNSYLGCTNAFIWFGAVLQILVNDWVNLLPEDGSGNVRVSGGTVAGQTTS